MRNTKNLIAKNASRKYTIKETRSLQTARGSYGEAAAENDIN